MADIKGSGKVVGVNGNMVTIEFKGEVLQNEVGYVQVSGAEGQSSLKSEVIRVKGNRAD
jgi:V/A-type H+-transporting ATPase subunit A